MNILVIGKGGREHALVWKLKQSPRAEKIFCAPGNAGTAGEGATNLAIDHFETDKLLRLCTREKIGLVVIGPEDPLAAGLSDFLRDKGFKVFGPSKAAARVEASKVFAKELMRHADVPTADFQVFDHPAHARTYVETRDYPVVVKADGLAAGKGVVVCKDNAEAMRAVKRIMTDEEFGKTAGRKIVVEKKLEGEELSVLALVSGRTFLLLPPCQDHKAVFDGDQGPNTGGMGAYCPSPLATPAFLTDMEKDVFFPMIHAMKRGRFPFQGVLYAGVMLTHQGLRVLEFNCRFGDPETQPLLMRLKTDLLDLLEAVADERLQEFEDRRGSQGEPAGGSPSQAARGSQGEPAGGSPSQAARGSQGEPAGGSPSQAGVEWDTRPAVCVVLCSGGYPGKYDNGKVIHGIAAADALPGVKVFQAGTRLDDKGQTVTDGGRVLGVTALGDDLAAAKARAYEAIKLITFPGMHYRTDIADKALKVRPAAKVAETPKLPAKFRRPPGGEPSNKPPAN